MPSFDFYVDEHISVDYFYDEMSKSEKKEMLERLLEDDVYEEAKASPAQEIFNEAMDKIKERRLQLPIYVEQMLLDLARSL
jgi:hypothetical protein